MVGPFHVQEGVFTVLERPLLATVCGLVFLLGLVVAVALCVKVFSDHRKNRVPVSKRLLGLAVAIFVVTWAAGQVGTRLPSVTTALLDQEGWHVPDASTGELAIVCAFREMAIEGDCASSRWRSPGRSEWTETSCSLEIACENPNATLLSESFSGFEEASRAVGTLREYLATGGGAITVIGIYEQQVAEEARLVEQHQERLRQLMDETRTTPPESDEPDLSDLNYLFGQE